MRVLLLGAGHAHIEVCRRVGELTARGIETVLVSPGGFWYSGLATGVLGGAYPAELDRIDAGALIRRGGGRHVRASAIRIEPAERRVILGDGTTLDYDLLSCNVGSRTDGRGFVGADTAVPVKPLGRLVGLRGWLDPRLETGASPRVLVAGGGASGCEVAANIAARIGGRGLVPRVTLATSGTVLDTMPAGAANAARAALRARGVDVREEDAVVEARGDVARLASGAAVELDVAIDATGMRPPPLLAESGLACDESGALRVNATLRSVDDPRVFAVGDCAAFAPRLLPRVGVFAVRQAPILLANLIAAAEDRPLEAYRPQRGYLLILNLGAGEGLAVRGRLHWRGRMAFALKDRLDRRFLDRYR